MKSYTWPGDRFLVHLAIHIFAALGPKVMGSYEGYLKVANKSITCFTQLQNSVDIQAKKLFIVIIEPNVTTDLFSFLYIIY